MDISMTDPALDPHDLGDDVDGVQMGITLDGDPVRTLELAEQATERVLGSVRVEHGDYLGDGLWLVRLTQAEYAILESQGFIELAKDNWMIQAEMP